MTSGHNVETLKDLMDERHRCYDHRFEAAEEAVRLAKQNTDATKGHVSVVLIISIIAIIIALADKVNR